VKELDRGSPNYQLMPALVDFLRKYPFMGPFISFNANVVKITLAQADRSFREMQA